MENNNEQEAVIDGDTSDDDSDNANTDDDDYDDDLLVILYNREDALDSLEVPFDVFAIGLLIHASVTEMHEFACDGFELLREVVFHNNVIAIGRYAFQHCANLERLELPEGLLRIGDSAFYNCTSLREIVIPASVQFMGPYVFAGCQSLERVVFAPTTTTLELSRGIFSHCVNLRSVTLPPHLHSIPAWFLKGCTSLTRLQLPASVEQIEAYAFYGSGIHASKISDDDEFIPGTILLPPNLQIISNHCFSYCLSLKKIHIPDSVQQIGEDALCGSGLVAIDIPTNVQQIDREACADCVSLQEVTIHSSNNLSMAYNIFARCPAVSVIKVYPWLWPKLFASMNEHPPFIFNFFRQYHTQIRDFETPSDVSERR